MLFNSLEFAAFLPIVFAIYWFAGTKNCRIQNAILIVASYIFYGYWDWRCLGLIAFTSAITYATALAIEKSRSREFRSRETENSLAIPPPQKNYNHTRLEKIFCGASIVVNLGILAIFKYYNFFATEFAEFFGVPAGSLALKIILPVGISFYTFSALSCTLDVFRGNAKEPRDPLQIFAMLSFFPQLFAGPISRASVMLPQYARSREFDAALATDGLRQMLWGFFKKMVIADNCARAVDLVWSDFGAMNGSSLAAAAVLYSIQIYGDFSGYSDMAIGCAKLFGIRIPPNFLFPYFSRNVAEFWRRWHISLNTWFRDYLYIPLGGSRCGKAKTIRNTLIIFAVCGFWHGANWTFLIWGIFHGLLFVPRLLMGTRKKDSSIVAADRMFPSLREILQIVGTFLLVTIGWIFFRAPSLHDALAFFERMLFSGTLLASPRGLGLGIAPIFLTIFMFAIEWIFRRSREHTLERVPVKNRVVRWCFYWLILALIWQYDGGAETFVYFQF